LDTIQAAILLAKLERFDDEVTRRQAIGARYTELLAGCGLSQRHGEDGGECGIPPSDFVSGLSRGASVRGLPCPPIAPVIEPFNTSVFAQYTISVDDRDALIARLKTRNIPTAVHYPVPLHLQPAFASYGYREGDFPIAEAAAKRVLSLPMGADLTDSDQLRIVAALAFGL
jgi:UDP-2-acetamido-2-deoxy-ribo-hexuluronate aminotransferase